MYDPTAPVGVPDIVPSPDNETLVGRLPDTTLKSYSVSATPPTATICAVYASFCIDSGKLSVVILIAGCTDII